MDTKDDGSLKRTRISSPVSQDRVLAEAKENEMADANENEMDFHFSMVRDIDWGVEWH